MLYRNRVNGKVFLMRKIFNQMATNVSTANTVSKTGPQHVIRSHSSHDKNGNRYFCEGRSIVGGNDVAGP